MGSAHILEQRCSLINYKLSAVTALHLAVMTTLQETGLKAMMTTVTELAIKHC